MEFMELAGSSGSSRCSWKSSYVQLVILFESMNTLYANCLNVGSSQCMNLPVTQQHNGTNLPVTQPHECYKYKGRLLVSPLSQEIFAESRLFPVNRNYCRCMMQISKQNFVSNSVLNAIGVVILGVAITATVLLLPMCEAGQQPTENFYMQSCPWAESIVKQVVTKHIAADPTLAGSVLRLHFHDCFVRVCQKLERLNT